MSEEKVLAEEATEDKDATKKVSQAYNPMGRFQGNGVSFKAKLFGTADVNEPRGDSVCNVAIGLLKSAVKNTGEHKQKIYFRVNMSGITIVDLMDQSPVYEHPVNKISFISRDPNDSRAFGYIVTEKEGKHLYVGIKTDKAADPVVVALRDMFQAVYEMKKKEAEEKAGGKTEVKKDESTTDTDKTDGAKTEPSAAPTSPTSEPILGDAAPPAENKQVQREDSTSRLLDLLGDLSFNPAPQPVAAAPAASASFNPPQWPPQSPAALSWGNAVPAQNDPFATLRSDSQPNAFTQQQPNQTTAFPQQVNGFQQPFQQPASHSPFSQPQQSQPFIPQAAQPFSPQAAQPFNPQVAQPFNAQAAQPAMFGAAPAQPAQFQQQQAQAQPFAQPQPNQFTSDPFATTNMFKQPAQVPSAAPQASNPFAAPAAQQSFGVLQPQQVAQPVQTNPYGQPQVPGSTNMFSDLNPLPSNNQQVRKDQFFSDIKNPPRPKMNEMQPSQAPNPNVGSPW